MSEYRKLLIKKLETLANEARLRRELEIAALIEEVSECVKDGAEMDLLLHIAQQTA